MDGVRGSDHQHHVPQGIVANAPKIIKDLRAFFPPQPGTFLIGPEAQAGWAEQTMSPVARWLSSRIHAGEISDRGCSALVLPTQDLGDHGAAGQLPHGALEFSKQRMYSSLAV